MIPLLPIRLLLVDDHPVMRAGMANVLGMDPDFEVLRRKLTEDDGGRYLSPRELEVLGLVRQGFTNDEIGRLLDISERTARAHMGSIMGKLEASDTGPPPWPAASRRASSRLESIGSDRATRRWARGLKVEGRKVQS